MGELVPSFEYTDTRISCYRSLNAFGQGQFVLAYGKSPNAFRMCAFGVDISIDSTGPVNPSIIIKSQGKYHSMATKMTAAVQNGSDF